MIIPSSERFCMGLSLTSNPRISCKGCIFHNWVGGIYLSTHNIITTVNTVKALHIFHTKSDKSYIQQASRSWYNLVKLSILSSYPFQIDHNFSRMPPHSWDPHKILWIPPLVPLDPPRSRVLQAWGIHPRVSLAHFPYPGSWSLYLMMREPPPHKLSLTCHRISCWLNYLGRVWGTRYQNRHVLRQKYSQFRHLVLCILPHIFPGWIPTATGCLTS